ncbi:MAG: uvrD [Candidatus Saccharibacteria bacterium]|nr:uvrD [Candidatus Saccharibacteria bacterium]
MSEFEREYKKLNAAQAEAVDQIDGPVLVIAGPGTGKTQLLSARVANILTRTDTLPQNILCLTFTESGAANMRQRLTRFIGQSAYDVTISTYHSFGSDLIYKFPQYFTETRLQNPVDELGKHQIFREIVEGLSYSNPLKQTRHHLGDLMSTISEVKRALLNAKDLRAIAKENYEFVNGANEVVRETFREFTTMPRKVDLALLCFSQTLEGITKLIPEKLASSQFGCLGQIAVDELQAAIAQAAEINKTVPLTAWKNKWLAKNARNDFIFDGELENKRIEALASVYEKYQRALEAEGLYDFDDMIIRAIEAMEKHPDLKYTLQERYLYVLLDEFQDTNAAQLRLVELLSDNPVHEGRPNIMAVGDDDQAIYAFQGAQYSNMLDFYNLYTSVKVVNLTENYRSHEHILSTSFNIAEQIEARLHHNFEGMDKRLVAANKSIPDAAIIRNEFLSDISQYDWMAQKIKELIDSGTKASEIAVIAPKHKQLEPLVPYLNSLNVPVRYEKRENILEAPVVRQLILMSRLVLALHENNEKLADALWPQVLSFDFWQIPTTSIWKLSWKINDNRNETSWTQALLEDETCKSPALLFMTLANKVDTETCEAMLDYLIGSEAVDTHESDVPSVQSPLREYYSSTVLQTDRPELFYETLSHLKVLRAKLREHQATTDTALTLPGLIKFIEMYESAGERMLNTSPYNQQSDAVQIMTVFKSKGLEFEHVFMPCCHDDVWGGSSRGNSNKLTLPANLSPIRHAGATDDERLRILFVALTRAKFGLYLSSYSLTYSGKPTKRLKYLGEQEQEDGRFMCAMLPEHASTVVTETHTAPELQLLELDWRSRHLEGIATSSMHGLLDERIKRYQLSPTHLNSFIDLQYGGPEKFFFNTLLRFPQAPGIDGQYGNAIHETLEWIQHRIDEKDEMPPIQDTFKYFAAQLKHKKLTEEQFKLEMERGELALTAYLQKRGKIFLPGDKAEHSFKNEGVFIGDVHMGGKIDRMEVDKATKTITVVDYKTGKAYSSWKSEAKLHKYRQQLYCYKLLIEGSHTFKGYTVTKGRLEFIEPDANSEIHTLEITFKDEEVERTKQLLQAMWRYVQKLELPDTSAYSKDLRGIQAFEHDLIASLDTQATEEPSISTHEPLALF